MNRGPATLRAKEDMMEARQRGETNLDAYKRRIGEIYDQQMDDENAISEVTYAIDGYRSGNIHQWCDSERMVDS